MLLDEHTACWVLRLSMMSTACQSSAAALTHLFPPAPAATDLALSLTRSRSHTRLVCRHACHVKLNTHQGPEAASVRKQRATQSMGTPKFAEGSCRFKALDQR